MRDLDKILAQKGLFSPLGSKLLQLQLVMADMKAIQAGKIVELKYSLRDGGAKGEILEIMDEHWPLKFYFGGGSMLPAFERQLQGLGEGRSFSFTLRAEEAYGAIQSELIEEIALADLPESERFPLKDFEVGDRLVFGMGGKKERLGTINEVLESSVLVDFNHALAGKELHFSGQVLFIREPSAEEARAQRYIEPNGIRSDSRLGHE